jgi:serine/threonine-protein kinase
VRARQTAPAIPTDRFVLGELLGSGGMGEVRAARDVRIGREVAVKALHGAAAADASTVARFLREARIQGRLDHPAIVPVYDLGRDESGAPYFAMKRLTGITLQQVLHDWAKVGESTSTWTRHQVLARLIDVCLALDFAHSRGVIHRDVKPGNIVLGDYGEVYVIDWGIARVVDDDGADDRTIARADLGDVDEPHTAVGAVLGTAGYMAPEQQLGEVVDARADVYALGCVLYEVLTVRAALPRAVDGKPPPIARKPISPRQRHPELDIPPELDELCVHATDPERDDRLASARELATGIQRYLDGDRDLRRRRDVAARLTEAARAALAFDTDDARRLAMREAGRALALDPDHRDAHALVSQLVVEPVRAVPPEVEQAIRNDRVRASKAQVRLAALVYAGHLAFLSAIWLRAPQSPWLLGLMGAIALDMLLFLLVATRDRPIGALIYPGLAVHCATVGLAGVITSPLLIVPPLAIGAIAGFLSQPSTFRPVPVIVSHVACLAVPVALELGGILPRTFWIDGKSLRVEPWAVDLSPPLLLLVVAAVTLGQLASTAALVIQLRRARDRAEQRLHVRLWQLAQLIPE